MEITFARWFRRQGRQLVSQPRALARRSHQVRHGSAPLRNRHFLATKGQVYVVRYVSFEFADADTRHGSPLCIHNYKCIHVLIVRG